MAGVPFTVVNPADESVLAEILLGNAVDAERAVEAAKTAFPGWSASDPKFRFGIIERIIAGIESRREELAQVQSLTMGAPVAKSRLGNVDEVLGYARGILAGLRNFQFEERLGTTLILREPIGVCALITPWNWPLGQIIQKVLPAIATGCTMVLKPSEITPFDAVIFAEIVTEAGLPAGVFNLVQGDGPTVGGALSAHPDVALVSFTGSTRAGIDVARAAAGTVKRVCQELGGKSANILLPNADFAKMVPIGTREGMRNSGQSCSAPTRMLVPRDRFEEAKRLAKRTAESIVVGNPWVSGVDLGPLANSKQFDKVQSLIEAALAEGAELVAGGTGRPEGLEKGYYCRPTVLAMQSSDDMIAQTEIFGPVLCMIPYEDEEDAIRIANNSVYGLGGYVQSQNQIDAQRIARRIRAGAISVNDPDSDFNAPFGGYKMSGNGRERGRYGLDDYLEVKSIIGFYERQQDG
ncbi:aldehyde dehydrogenase family protein [Mesorhizobium sp. ORM8.1]